MNILLTLARVSNGSYGRKERSNLAESVNEWQQFTDWGPGTPPTRLGHAAATVEMRNDQSELSTVMVLYGGAPNSHCSFSTLSTSDLEEYTRTWLFETNTHRWYPVTSRPRPPPLCGHSVTTLCDHSIVLFGGTSISGNSSNSRRSFSNETWVFDSWQSRWTQIDAGEGPSVRAYHSATVMLSSVSECECGKSLLIFGGLSDEKSKRHRYEMLDDLWELRCTSEANNSRVYRWFQLPKTTSKWWPRARSHHLAVTNSPQQRMYVYGGYTRSAHNETDLYIALHDVWYYSWTSRKWHWEYVTVQTSVRSGKEIKDVLSLLQNGNGLLLRLQLWRYVPNTDAFVMCCKWPVKIYFIHTGRWYIPQSFIYGVAGPLVLSHSSLVALNTDGALVLQGRTLWRIQFQHSTFTHRLEVVWSQVDAASVFPVARRGHAAALSLRDDTIYLHGGIFGDRETGESLGVLWMLDTSTMVWKPSRPPERPPHLTGHSGTTVTYPSTLFVLFGGIATEDGLVTGKLWLYDPFTNAWSEGEEDFERSPAARWGHIGLATEGNTLIVHGGLTERMDVLSDVWYYNLKWKDRVHRTYSGLWSPANSKPGPALFGHSAVIIKGIMYVYGGGMLKESFFDVYRSRSALNSSRSDTKALPNIDIVPFPNEGEIYTHTVCSSSLWSFNVSQGSWSKIQYGDYGPGKRCFHASAALGDTMVLAGGCLWKRQNVGKNGKYFTHYRYSCSSLPGLWMFYVEKKKWSTVISSPMPEGTHFQGRMLVWMREFPSVAVLGGTPFKYDYVLQSPKDESVTIVINTSDAENQTQTPSGSPNSPIDANTVDWHSGDYYYNDRGSGFAAGGDDYGEGSSFQTYGKRNINLSLSLTASDFWTLTIGCPTGMYSKHITTSPCQQCPLGSYTNAKGSIGCQRCPSGLWTLNVSATSKAECRVCHPSEDICKHGRCSVSKKSGDTPQRECICEGGYTEDSEGNCTVPTYFLVAMGIVLGIILVTVLVLCSVKLRRISQAKRAKERELNSRYVELEELTEVWMLDSRELDVRERIDRDCPGGFGQIHKAIYREMTVAVKILQITHCTFQTIRDDFDREMEIMRSLRHPNIVLFIGGGERHTDRSPFIVVEFLARGSLGGILRNKSLELSFERRIKFSLDAARGMAFLHGRRPPRIHRDLKSDNLLVSESWLVKVADFGSATLERAHWYGQNTNAPALRASLATLDGTLLWNSPEVLREEEYGTPVDIYRSD